MPSSAQIELATYKLVAILVLAVDLLDHVDAAYYTSLCLFSWLLLNKNFPGLKRETHGLKVAS